MKQCPRCGYEESFSKEEAFKKIEGFLVGWTPRHRETMTQRFNSVACAKGKPRNHVDELNFLMRLGRDGISSTEALTGLHLLFDTKWDRITEMVYPWAYCSTVLSNNHSTRAKDGKRS